MRLAGASAASLTFGLAGRQLFCQATSASRRCRRNVASGTERTHRGDRAHVRFEGGSGLGLSDGVRSAYDPGADTVRIEISQCSGLLPYRFVLSAGRRQDEMLLPGSLRSETKRGRDPHRANRAECPPIMRTQELIRLLILLEYQIQMFIKKSGVDVRYNPLHDRLEVAP